MEDLEDTHVLFKEFITEHRPKVDIEKVATGEIWFGKRALTEQLVDSIQTSDEYLFSLKDTADIFEVSISPKKSLSEKLGISVEAGIESALTRWYQRLTSRIPM